MSDNWDKNIPCEGLKAKDNRKYHVSFYAWAADNRWAIKELFMLYFVSDPESESIRSPESEWEQPHRDSAPLVPVLT